MPNAQNDRPLHRLSRDFEKLDLNRSGTLCREEVKQGLRARGLPCSHEAVGKLFEQVDRNADGSISYEEYLEFVSRRIVELRAVYDAVDKNGDGRLTSSELRSAAATLGYSISSSQLRSLHQEADGKKCGVITFEDFCSFLFLLPSVNPAAVFEAILESRYVEHGLSEYAPPAEVVASTDREHLLAALAAKVYSGSIAGGVSRTATAPLDRLKTIMQAAPPGQPQTGLLEGLRSVYRQGGVRAFFQGNTANVIKIAPETSIKFVAFDQLKTGLAADPGNVTAIERWLEQDDSESTDRTELPPVQLDFKRQIIAYLQSHGEQNFYAKTRQSALSHVKPGFVV